MLNPFSRPKRHDPVLIGVIVDCAVGEDRILVANMARTIADMVEAKAVPCDGQTALRMFAANLEQMTPG